MIYHTETGHPIECCARATTLNTVTFAMSEQQVFFDSLTLWWPEPRPLNILGSAAVRELHPFGLLPVLSLACAQFFLFLVSSSPSLLCYPSPIFLFFSSTSLAWQSSPVVEFNLHGVDFLTSLVISFSYILFPVLSPLFFIYMYY